MARWTTPIRESPKRDPQQYLVYRMENEAIGHAGLVTLTHSEILKIARKVCRNYRVPQVKIEWADMTGAAEWTGSGLIRLSTKKGTASHLVTITHELAHHVQYHLAEEHGEDQEDHGSEFMACHMSILDSCRIVPVVGMKAICDAYGIHYLDPGNDNDLDVLIGLLKKKGQ